MKKILMISVLALGLVFAGTASADHECGGGQCPMKGGSEKSCERGGSDCEKGGCPILNKILMKSCFFLSNKTELGLSDEQVAKIQGIQLEAKKSAVKMGADMQLWTMDLEAKLSEPTVDVQGISAMIDQGTAAMGQSAKTSVQWYADLKAVLTPEQMAKAKEIWSKKS